ncbi:MAG: hypothetical protein N4A35_12220 [Flavobacteriales bacterium]|jgi:putative addiction module component (TIGR02574 family)|nr:hypothetical protein [Flavobacteriales bacterium]
MKITLNVKDHRVSDFLNFIESLDFVEMHKETTSLSKTQKITLDKRIDNHKNQISKSYSWEEAKNQIRTQK